MNSDHSVSITVKQTPAGPRTAVPVGTGELVLPLDIAFIRWSVVCARWEDFAAGHTPLLQAFLAGWFCRCIGATMPTDTGTFRESFRAGWFQANEQIEIASRQNTEISGRGDERKQDAP